MLVDNLPDNLVGGHGRWSGRWLILLLRRFRKIVWAKRKFGCGAKISLGISPRMRLKAPPQAHIPPHPHSERWHQLVDEHQVTVKATKTTILKPNMKTVSNSKKSCFVPGNCFEDSTPNTHTPEMVSSAKTTTPTRTLIIPGLKLDFKAMPIPIP